MTTSTRTRKKTTLTISAINVEFIRERIMPANPDYCEGKATRGLHFCVDFVLDCLAGDFPEVPPRERDGRDDLQTVDATFEPATMEALDRIVDYWKGTDGQCSRSGVVDYFLDQYRKVQAIWDAEDEAEAAKE